MSPFEAFVFGSLGSVLVEVVNVLTCFQRGKIPTRYYKPVFWLVRFFLVIGAGIIALAHDVQTKILAVHLGVATPLILQAFAKSNPNDAVEE